MLPSELTIWIMESAVNREKRSLPRWIIVPVVFVIGMILWVSVNPIGRFISQHTPVPYYQLEEPLVKAAIREAFGAGANIAEVKSHSYPVVVRLPDMNCVGFNLRPGWIGVTETVCFRKNDGSVAIRHTQ